MNKQELKNCPFCGGRASLAIDGDNHTYGGCSDHEQKCIGSDILPWLSDKEEVEASAECNTRPEEDKLNARIKELEEGLQYIINHIEMGMKGDKEALKMHAHWYIATKTLNKGIKK